MYLSFQASYFTNFGWTTSRSSISTYASHFWISYLYYTRIHCSNPIRTFPEMGHWESFKGDYTVKSSNLHPSIRDWLVVSYKATSLSMVPSMWHQFLKHPDFSKTDLSTVLDAHSGAAHLPKEISSEVLKNMPNSSHFSEGYGMSETVCRPWVFKFTVCSLWALQTVSAIVRPYPGTLNSYSGKVLGSTGALLPGMEARIVREDGTDADFDEIGELWLKGENIVSGYFDNPKATQESFVDGWLHTGDRFKVDRDNYFLWDLIYCRAPTSLNWIICSFADRVKVSEDTSSEQISTKFCVQDTLKVSGSQVSPIEIEEVLLAHPQRLVSDVTVAGVRGSGRTSDELVPRAWVVLSGNGKSLGAARTKEELEKWHKINLSRYKWLRGGIEVITEVSAHRRFGCSSHIAYMQVPKSPTGKTLRRLLQNQYEQQLMDRAKLWACALRIHRLKSKSKGELRCTVEIL